jgi:hypothetical protein
MRKYSVLLLSAVALGSFVFVLSSCDDDEPSPPPQLSFAVSELTVKESDANLNLEIVLDKPAPEDIVIEYSIKGTARESVTAGSAQLPADYEIVSDYLEAEIKQGETTAVIEIDLYSDTDMEVDDETIEIAIEETDSDKIEITRDDDMTITVKQEDGLLVFLAWGEEDNDYPDVDMDLFLWVENDAGELALTDFRGVRDDSYSNWIGGNFPEFFFIPTALAEDGNYGLSCTYYEGTVEPMNFEVSYVEVVNGDEASSVSKTGTYTLVNINKWDDETLGTEHQLVATFKKAGADFAEFSDITIPTAGSRMGVTSTSEFKRGGSLSPGFREAFKQFQKK